MLKALSKKQRTAIAAAMLAAMAFVCSCGEDERIKPKLPVGERIEDIPSYVMQGFKLTSTESAEERWEFSAKGAQIFEMKKKAYAQGVFIKYYTDSKKASTLRGDKAVISLDTNFMEITGNVSLKGPDGAVMKTQKLYWDDAQRKLYTDAEVMIIRKGAVLSGVGFESDAEMKNMVIKKKVKFEAKDIQ